jgi:hypothetical protein
MVVLLRYSDERSCWFRSVPIPDFDESSMEKHLVSRRWSVCPLALTRNDQKLGVLD